MREPRRRTPQSSPPPHSPDTLRLLILGGTSEARELARQLVDQVAVTSSLAGRVAEPRLPVGGVRIGGFGGVPGLRAALADYDAVLDATHPFAQRMSANAAAACDLESVPLLRVERPGWEPNPLWHYVDDHNEAAVVAADKGARPLLTVGRQELASYVPALESHTVVARVVDTPAIEMPPSWTIIRSRGPYTLAGERALLQRHTCDVLVTKDSGGTYTWPKLAAAGELGVAVIVVRRPDALDGVLTVHDVGSAVAWVKELS